MNQVIVSKSSKVQKHNNKIEDLCYALHCRSQEVKQHTSPNKFKDVFT